MQNFYMRSKKLRFTNTIKKKNWSFWNVYLCIRLKNPFSDKTNTQKMVFHLCEEKKLHRDVKLAFVYLCIFVRAKEIRNHSLRL